MIAYRSGSVPEVVEDGVTGFIVENEEQAVRAVGELGRLDRRRVRVLPLRVPLARRNTLPGG